ncbi:MAG TPA: hypothetical protein VJX74_12600 [Blastocatellia bacterium]|nr:hypothetical protein [Blastocatellia bacterium]
MTKIQTYIHAISRAQKAALSLFFVTVAVFFISTSNIEAQTRAPELVIESTKRDFGDVFAGEELVQVFPIRNTGSIPLELAEKSTTTGLRLPSSRELIKTVSFNPSAQAVPIAVAANRAAPS